MEASRKAMPDTDSPREHTMYAYEIAMDRAADLIRRADEERRAREAVRLARAARRETEARGVEHESHSRRPRRSRFARAV
ncbi:MULTISPECIES: hypothetical protein [Streptomyces]|uniref:hypothetical protein n=1 Tax=Streptomyces TaxID=1883 RepID=UPI002DD99CF5|nr:hypothetical protein [Streptomyces hirsutus]